MKTETKKYVTSENSQHAYGFGHGGARHMLVSMVLKFGTEIRI